MLFVGTAGGRIAELPPDNQLFHFHPLFFHKSRRRNQLSPLLFAPHHLFNLLLTIKQSTQANHQTKTTQPLGLLERYFPCWSATSLAGALRPLLERCVPCWSATSLAGALRPLLERHWSAGMWTWLASTSRLCLAVGRSMHSKFKCCFRWHEVWSSLGTPEQLPKAMQ